jgi:hypothetical protein
MIEQNQHKSEFQKQFEGLAPLQKVLEIIALAMIAWFLGFIAYHSVVGW